MPTSNLQTAGTLRCVSFLFLLFLFFFLQSSFVTLHKQTLMASIWLGKQNPKKSFKNPNNPNKIKFYGQPANKETPKPNTRKDPNAGSEVKCCGINNSRKKRGEAYIHYGGSAGSAMRPKPDQTQMRHTGGACH